MSNKGGITCPHCGKRGIKSKRGLTTHINKNQQCKAARNEANAYHDEERSDNEDGNLDVSMMQVDHSMNANDDDFDVGCDAYDDDDNNGIDMNISVEMEIIRTQADDDWGVGYETDDSGEDDDENDPRQASIRQFRAYVKRIRDASLPIRTEMKTCVTLMDTLIRKRASLDTYDAILAWHKDVIEEETNKSRSYYSRKQVITYLANRYNMPKNLIYQHQITLPSSGTEVNIVYHMFEEQFVSLLTDPRFGDDDWLHFGDDPLAPPPENLDKIADINTGKCYRETYKELITRPGKQILIPIVWYLDGAATGQFNSLNVEALKFTIGILNRKARDKEYAWRTLGYVPNYSKHDATVEEMEEEAKHVASLLCFDEEEDDNDDQTAQNESQNVAQMFQEDDEKFESKKHPSQDLHRILAEILKSYRQTEQRGMVFDYKYKGKLYKNVEFVFFTAFIKCDTEEADKLCGSYTNRNRNVAQLCRYCCCPTNKTDDPAAQFPLKKVDRIRNLVENNNEEELKKLSQQNIYNAFHLLRFGSHNKMGVHGACPMEMLHHLLLGMFKTVRDCFFAHIGETSEPAKQINGLARLLGRYFQHQSDRDMPKTHYHQGIQEGKVMAKEMSGVLLNIAAVLHTTKGQQILKSVQNRGGSHFKDDWLIKDWSLLIETLLEWEAFLKLDEMTTYYVRKLKKKHQFIMHLILRIARRVEGMGYMLMKFHGILHMVMDIWNLGVPMVVDTGSNESHHKKTKKAARLTQRDQKKFEAQTARRLMEMHLLEIAKCELDDLNMWSYLDVSQTRGTRNKKQLPNNEKKAPETGGTAFKVIWDDSKERAAYRFRSKPTKATPQWDQCLIDFLYQLQEYVVQDAGLSTLEIRSEHKRQGTIFRGHPKYRSNRGWNDWAKFDWGEKVLPGEIWCFVDLRDASANFDGEFAGCCLQEGVYAVVESSLYCNEEVDETLMFTPLDKEGVVFSEDGTNVVERKFYLADVESIAAPVVVIPDIGNENQVRYFEVSPREHWAKNFMGWLEIRHEDDWAQLEED